MADAPVPTLVAMLLCDTVIQDAQTTKKSLIGIFTQVNAIDFPTTVNATVFARLTDAEGKYKFRLDVVNLTENKTILSLPSPHEVEAPSQLALVEIVLQFQRLPVPSAGKYEFQLWANDAYLGRTTMEAAGAKQQ
jgi:uncharacterized protein DUF6941